MKIRIGLAQMDPALGLFERNRDAHLELVERARSEKADLLLFPELSLTGYQLKDLVPELGRSRDHADLKPLLEASRGMDLVFGFVERSEDLRHFNALAYAAGGALVHVHRKVYLPTYGMFDERRYFAAGDTVRAFPTRFGRLALAVCEDIWHPSVPYLAFMDRALGLLVGSAGPARGMGVGEDADLPGVAAWWDALLRYHASQYGAFLAYCNRAGVEDGTSFWGGSRLVAAGGERVAVAELHAPGLVVGEIDLRAQERGRREFSVLRDERPELTFRVLERILRDRAEGEDPAGSP